SAGLPILYGIATDGWVPSGNALLLANANAQKVPEDLEHSLYDTLKREIGAERFLVEVVQSGALLFCPIADVPGFKLVPRELLQFLIFFFEAADALLMKVV